MSRLSLMERAHLADRQARKSLRCTIWSALAAAEGKRVGVAGATPEETDRAVERARAMAIVVGADPSLIVPVREVTGEPRRVRAVPRWTIDRLDVGPDGLGAFRCGWELRPRTALYMLDRPPSPIGKVAVAYRDGRTFVMSAPTAEADRRYGMRVVEARPDGGVS